MRAVSDVMPKRMLRFCCGGNTAFGHNLHTFTQRRRTLQRFAKGSLALIAAINISVIDGGDPEIEMLFNEACQLKRGHIPVHQTPVAHDKTGEFRALRGKGNTLNHNIFLKEVMSPVYAITLLKQ